jgi:hypothetical protein
MYSNSTIRKIMELGILASMVLGIVLISTAEADAQRRVYWPPIQRDYRFPVTRSEIEQIAQTIGYRDGRADGDDAADDGEPYDPYNEGRYKNALNGYRPRFTDREFYREAYRAAYLEGYREGYDRDGD